MAKVNETTKALNEQTNDVMKKLKAAQVSTSELIQRLKRLEQPKPAPGTTVRSDSGDFRQNRSPRPAAGNSGQNRTGKPEFNNNQKRDFKPAGQKKQGGIDDVAAALPPQQEKERITNYESKKTTYQRVNENEKRGKNKKQMIRNQAPSYEDDRFRNRKKKRNQYVPKIEPIVITDAVLNTETVSVKDLSEKLGKPSANIIKQLLVLGIFATINQEIDVDTAQLIADEFGIKLDFVPHVTSEDVMLKEVADDKEEDLVKRPPVVTIMGHVDHGKTSLLDAIRSTKVTKGEAGGITQHIGAYSITKKDQKITFLDTPGHEAFTSMRARGTSVTDVAVLVVAADDGIKPQTVEAIAHAKAAEVPIIIAINKIDKPAANIEKVKQELTEHELVPEEWGGDVVVVPVSAKTGDGIDELLDMILLVSEVQELKANPNRNAVGAIIEARLDKGRGPVATVLIQNGTLKVGDTIVAGTAYGHVRAMIDDEGAPVEKAGPSDPVAVLGFGEVPQAGDLFYVVEDDRLSRQVAEERKDKMKIDQVKRMQAVTLDDLFDKISEGDIKVLNLIVKADVQGTAEALKQSLEKISTDEVKIEVIHSGVGGISQTDVSLAAASNAIIIGFNVVADATARNISEKDGIDIRTYRVIYNVIEDIEKALVGMLDPEFKEVILGHIEVRQIFKVSGIGTIAGAYVTDGKVLRNSHVRLTRDGVVIHEGEMNSLKRFKDDAKEVAAGYECGIGIEGYNDLKEGDIIEAYTEEEVKRSV